MKCLVSVVPSVLFFSSQAFTSWLGKGSCQRAEGGTKIHTMSDEAAKVTTDNAVPCRSLPIVECLLDMLGNVLQSYPVNRCVVRLEEGQGVVFVTVRKGTKTGREEGDLSREGSREGLIDVYVPSQW